jgi:hypothetical protein
MILGDLLDQPVLGADGAPLGHVIDARLVLDGPVTPGGAMLAAPRLHGLLVSPRTGGSFVGYERTEVTSPWLIAHWLRWRHRGTFLVRWEDVAGLDDHGVRLRAGFRRLSPALPGRHAASPAPRPDGPSA